MAKELLIFQGPTSSRSGYGDHSRDLVRSLIAMDRFDVKIVDMRWGDCPRNALTINDTDISSRILTQNQNNQPDVFVQVSVPNEFNPIGKYNIGITAGIETTIAPTGWLEGCNRMNLIIVPSKHSKDVLVNTTYDRMDKETKIKNGELKLTSPIEVLFEGADLSIWFKTNEISKTVHDKISKIPEDFCFLHVGHWLAGDEGHSRKDTGGMIRTFCNTFKGGGYKKRPALILKTSSATFSIIDREEMLKKIRNIRNTFVDPPNVYLLHGDLEPIELNSLYNHPKVKAHISFTKGEGFGRPLLEATLSGKPVFASAWSGQLDFLAPNSTLFPGDLAKLHPSAVWGEILLADSQWFNVNYNYASKLLKDVYKSYKKHLAIGKKQMTYSKNNFNLEKMNTDFANIMDKYTIKNEEVKLTLPTLPKLQRV